MTRYTLSPQAADALREIWGYIARDNPDAADSVLERLAEKPNIGHWREDLTGGKTLRVWSVYAYLIFYDPLSRPLEIGRIVHGNRDVAELLRVPGDDPVDPEAES